MSIRSVRQLFEVMLYVVVGPVVLFGVAAFVLDVFGG